MRLIYMDKKYFLVLFFLVNSALPHYSRKHNEGVEWGAKANIISLLAYSCCRDTVKASGIAAGVIGLLYGSEHLFYDHYRCNHKRNLCWILVGYTEGLICGKSINSAINS